MMATSSRKRPPSGRGNGVCGRLSLFWLFSGSLLLIFLLSTVWMHTTHLGHLPVNLSPNLSYKEMSVLLDRVKRLQKRSERLSSSLHSWRSLGYEAQAYKDIVAPLRDTSSSGDPSQPDYEDTEQTISAEDLAPTTNIVINSKEAVAAANSVAAEIAAAAAAAAAARREGDDASGAMDKKQQGHGPVKPLMLMVGGTDGSGTRSVVDLLQSLGVKMMIEDEGTMDVHGWEMQGGWPPTVKTILRHTHSANYEVTSLPSSVQDHVRTELQKFLTGKEHEAAQQQPRGGGGALRGRARGGGSKRKAGTTAGVRWGFKAPVSMLLLPFFHHMTRGVKFLHVMRDGRDISFSGNQSPVDKFYDVNYGFSNNKNEDPLDGRGPLKAMRLWSDWNVDIADWAAKHQDGVTFDYLQIRTEDLVDAETKYDVYKKVARFVGADLSDEEMCCMVRAPTKWMGSHDSNAQSDVRHRTASSKVKSRYGSWKEKVAGRPELQEELESLGARGLERFGYHPRRTVVEFPDSQCPAAPDNCRGGHHRSRLGGQQGEAAAVVPGDSDECTYAGNVDFRGAGIDLYADNADSAEGCCRLCVASDECTAFTYSPPDGLCYLKSSDGSTTPNPALLSGRVVASTRIQ